MSVGQSGVCAGIIGYFSMPPNHPTWDDFLLPTHTSIPAFWFSSLSQINSFSTAIVVQVAPRSQVPLTQDN